LPTNVLFGGFSGNRVGFVKASSSEESVVLRGIEIGRTLVISLARFELGVCVVRRREVFRLSMEVNLVLSATGLPLVKGLRVDRFTDDLSVGVTLQSGRTGRVFVRGVIMTSGINPFLGVDECLKSVKGTVFVVAADNFL
jgi:hypothetical protein